MIKQSAFRNSLLLLLAFFGMILVFEGCSSSSTTPADEVVDAEVAGISNDDFQKKSPQPFSENEDYYKNIVEDNDVLSRESLGKVQAYKLDEMDDVSDEMAKAIGLCYRGKYKEADDLFDSIYDVFREHPGYWNQIGICFFKKNDLRSAMLYFNKALSIKSNYAPAINNLGVLYIKKGKEQNAVLAFEEALKYHKSSRTPKFNLAQLYLKYGFLDKAQKLLMDLYTSNEKDVDVLNAIAVSYLLRGKIEEAKRYFEMIEVELFKEPYIGINYAYVLKALKMNDEAKSIIGEIKIDRRNKLYTYYTNVRRFVEKK